MIKPLIITSVSIPRPGEVISELHRCEPYVYAQMIAGKDAASHGEAKNSWLTGMAAWNYSAITHWILGIRPNLDGLQIAPRIPSAWEGFKATRQFRAATYQITVRREGAGDTAAIRVDGRPLAGDTIPAAPGGTVVHVEAILS